MENQNQVTMSLEEYTNIILEKQKLELKLKALQIKAERKIEEEVKDGLINNLSKEDTIKWLNENPKKLLSQFGPYSWAFTSIANDILIFSEQELKDAAVAVILKMLNSHLNDILATEEQSNGNL